MSLWLQILDIKIKKIKKKSIHYCYQSSYRIINFMTVKCLALDLLCEQVAETAQISCDHQIMCTIIKFLVVSCISCMKLTIIIYNYYYIFQQIMIFCQLLFSIAIWWEIFLLYQFIYFVTFTMILHYLIKFTKKLKFFSENICCFIKMLYWTCCIFRIYWIFSDK